MSDLSDDDVVSIESSGFGTGNTFKVSELMKKVQVFANKENRSSLYPNFKVRWFTSEGVTAEVLKPNGGWRKGRLRFRLEFIPDEPLPDSQIDDPEEDAAI